MLNRNTKKPTLKTWLRIKNEIDHPLISGLFQHRRVRELQIREALNTPERYLY
ncbi:MAG: hypothetical protein ACI8QD_001648 [Cyclobacteriaceae bacterium]|jgi:hypothetical protein